MVISSLHTSINFIRIKFVLFLFKLIRVRNKFLENYNSHACPLLFFNF